MLGSKLKVLIAHHRWWFPTYVSGADLANHEIARKLMERGIDVRVHGICPPDVSKHVKNQRYQAEGVPVYLVTSDFISQLAKEIRDFRPDVVLTSCPEPSCGMDDMTRMVDTFNRFDLPTVLYVHNIDTTLPLFEDSRDRLSMVVTNSRFMGNLIEQRWEKECKVVYPIPDWKSIDANGASGPFITFFNPSPEKGLGVAHSLVKTHFADRPFLFVEGFIDPEAHGIALSRSGNLVHARRSPDVATIYMMTNIVIIPSQWEEPFGRIALEAMYNNIPVIASQTGGLAESVGDGGILIDDFTNVDKWVQAIKKLDDPAQRQKIIDKGVKHVEAFSLDQEIDKLIEILKNVA